VKCQTACANGGIIRALAKTFLDWQAIEILASADLAEICDSQKFGFRPAGKYAETVIEHGLAGYRRHRCHCDVCMAANRTYMRHWRAGRRGLQPVQDSGAPVGAAPDGPVVRGVRAEIGLIGDAVSRRPGLVESALRMAAIVDDHRLATTAPSACRRLVSALDELRRLECGPADRLGVALALCTLPWLGFVPDKLASASPVAVARLADQLKVDAAQIRSYGRRAQTRTDHLRLVAQHLGVQSTIVLATGFIPRIPRPGSPGPP
jgi:hypothetical protein